MLFRVTPARIIEMLGLVPHPEGGHYRETWRHDNEQERGAGSAIYYLLQAGERSHWHRIDAAEIWHFYAGAPLELLTRGDGGDVIRHVLGPEIVRAELPQIVVAPNEWQSARSLGDWTLVGCTVSPAFDFERFELAPKGWSPG
jgi:predicted cupin superfamily sugar epimerase